MDLETIPSEQVRPRARTRKPKQPVEAAAAPGPTDGVTYIARKPIKIGAKKFKIGDVVPEANSWTRVESWVRSGYLDVVEV
jgi:hypothetical protein